MPDEAKAEKKQPDLDEYQLFSETKSKSRERKDSISNKTVLKVQEFTMPENVMPPQQWAKQVTRRQSGRASADMSRCSQVDGDGQMQDDSYNGVPYNSGSTTAQ